MKKIITLITFCCMIGTVNAQYAIQETFGPTGDPANLAFSNYTSPKGLTFTTSGTGTVDMRYNLTQSLGYQNASSGRYVYFPNQNTTSLQIKGFNTSGLTNPTLAFGIRRSDVSKGTGANLKIEYSTDDTNWITLTGLVHQMSTMGNDANTWKQVAFTGLPKAASLSIRFTKTDGVTVNYFIDDVSIDGQTAFTDFTFPVYTAPFTMNFGTTGYTFINYAESTFGTLAATTPTVDIRLNNTYESNKVDVGGDVSASGGQYLYLGATKDTRFQLSGINTTQLTKPALGFIILRGPQTGTTGADLAVQYSTDGGSNWTTLPGLVEQMDGQGNNTWRRVAFKDLPKAANLTIRFIKTDGTINYFIDDISVAEETTFPVLPIQLSSFSATKAGATAILQWATQTESNNSHFDIERSVDGSTFTLIGTKQGAGNSSTVQNYRFTDYNPAGGANYYRLVQYDNDGRSTVYGVKAVSFDVNGTGMQLLANGNPQQINLSLQAAKGGNAQVAVYSVDGKKVSAQNVAINAGNNIYTLNVPQLSTGVYVVVLQLSGSTYKAKLIK